LICRVSWLALAATLALAGCSEQEQQAKVDEAFQRCMAKVPANADMATRPPPGKSARVYRKNDAPELSVDEQKALYAKALNMRRVCETMRTECRRGYFSIQCQAELNSNGN